jgi:hypothetical protein
LKPLHVYLQAVCFRTIISDNMFEPAQDRDVLTALGDAHQQTKHDFASFEVAVQAGGWHTHNCILGKGRWTLSTQL